MDVKNNYEKYKNVIPYLFFGVCTTLVNVISYWIAAHQLNLGVMISTLAAWILAVFFAYITNRKWVFHSRAFTRQEIAKEISSFFACRLITGVADWTCMLLFVGFFAWNDVVVKFFTNILVIVMNYIASKLLIFKER